MIAPPPAQAQSSKRSSFQQAGKSVNMATRGFSARQVAPVNPRRVSALAKKPPSRWEQAWASFTYFMHSILDPHFDTQNLAKGVELPGTPHGCDRLGAL